MDPQTGYFSDAEEASEPSESPMEEQDEAKTALLPLNFFQGKELKPGSTCTVRISEVMDDQVSVEYVGSESEAEPEEMVEAPVEDFMG